jgi:transposase
MEGRNRDRKKAIRAGAAYETGAYSYQQIGKHFGVYVSTVVRVVRETKEKPMSKRSGISRFLLCY